MFSASASLSYFFRNPAYLPRTGQPVSVSRQASTPPRESYMEIRPFRGWRYNAPRGGDVSDLIAPPYDVLSGADKARLLARDERNIVAVDLPHTPPKEVGPDTEYEQAAGLLAQWKQQQVLVRDPAPAIYLCREDFTWAGTEFSRREIVCAVRLSPPGQDIIPHEHTFKGPVADRLKLTEHTRMQMSAVMGFFDDPVGEAMDALTSAAGETPDAAGQLEGVKVSMWAIDDADTIAAAAGALKDVPVFIADGHHRCATAMEYRDRLRGSDGIGADHPANFITFVMSPGDEPGMRILPTHRIIKNLRDDFRVDELVKAADAFRWRSVECPPEQLRDTDKFLAGADAPAVVLVSPQSHKVWIGELCDPEAMKRAAPDKSDTWRSLGAAVAQKLIIEGPLAKWGGDDAAVEYTPHAGKVVQKCSSGEAQLGICLPSTPIDAVRKIALSGGAMPQKSTYFYPKPPTGMVLRPLE